MAGMEFEYDEEGGTFYFFLLSFMALVLVPATYYLWGFGEGKGKRRSVVHLFTFVVEWFNPTMLGYTPSCLASVNDHLVAGLYHIVYGIILVHQAFLK